MKAINVDVCRAVRRDGHLWLDMVFSIPYGYRCVNLQVTPTFYSPKYIEGNTLVFRQVANNVIPGIENTIDNICVDEIWGVDMNTAGIYHVEIECEKEEDVTEDNWPDVLDTELYVSDVEFVYHCMLPSLLNLCDPCATLPDSVLSQYLMLWGHIAALQAKDLHTAEYLYRKMLNCGNRCQQITTIDCGCHGKH